MNYHVFLTIAALTTAYGQATESSSSINASDFNSAIDIFEQNPSATTCSQLFSTVIVHLKKTPWEKVKNTFIIPLAKIAREHTELVLYWINNELFIKAPEYNGFFAAIFLEAGLSNYARLLLDNTNEFTQIMGFSKERTQVLLLVLITQITLYDSKTSHQAVSLLSRGEPNFLTQKGAWGNILHLLTQLALGPNDQQNSDPESQILYAVFKTAESICIYAKIYSPTLFKEQNEKGLTPSQVANAAKETCGENRKKTRMLLEEIELMLQ